MVDPNDLAVIEFQTVLQHTGKEVQLGFPGSLWRGEPINSVPDVQQEQHHGGGGVELRPLSVGLVDLLHSTPQQVCIETQAVPIHLHV